MGPRLWGPGYGLPCGPGAKSFATGVSIRGAASREGIREGVCGRIHEARSVRKGSPQAGREPCPLGVGFNSLEALWT
jgi:hypothetical protein